MRRNTLSNRCITYTIALGILMLTMLAGSTAAESASAAQIARVIAPTKAYTNPGFGDLVKVVPTITPYGHDQMQLRVLASVPGEVDPDTGVQRTYYLVHLPYRRSRLDTSSGNVGWVASDTVQVIPAVYTVKINRARRRLTLTRNGKTYKIWKVVVGTKSTPTPTGHFAVYGRTTRNHPFDGTGLMPFAYSGVLARFDAAGPGTPANGMVALHGRAGASLAQPVGGAYSHGCIRMNNSNMEILLAKLPIGTPVDVT